MESKNLKVVMLPWLAHGHISSYFELAKKLSMNNFSVHFCSTPVILDSVKHKLAEQQYYGNYRSLRLVEMNLPSLPELPAEMHKTSGLSLPRNHLSLLVKHFLDSAPSIVRSILETIKPDLIIFDIMQPWLPSLASSLGIPAVHFLTTGVAASACFYQIAKHPAVERHFAEMCLNKAEIKKIEDLFIPRHRDLFYGSLDGSCDMVLMKCCEEMEGNFIDYISDLSKKRVVSVGPLHVHDSIYDDDDNDVDIGEILRWLDKKEESSTLFVCFESESFLSKEEMEELAYGLDGSNVNFLWVIKASPGEKIKKVEDILPEGFIERVKQKGKIVYGCAWVPHAKILKHESIGGFLSPCGWSSLMESLSVGVPIVALAVQRVQRINARMLVDIGVAVEVVRGENGVANKEEVAKVIKEVVVVAQGGGEVRKKARELGEKIKAKGNQEYIDNLVVELEKLCKKYNEIKPNEIGNVGN